jgi:hypothetical protein
MFNLAGRFDRRRFWIYARHAAVGDFAFGERLAGLRCRFRLMASLDLLTIVGTDARMPPFGQGEKAVWIKCYSKVSRKPRAVQLHR